MSVKGVMTTHWPWPAMTMMLSRISASTRRGELTLVTVMRDGREASSSTVQPCSIAEMALGIASVQHEARGRVRELRLDELAPEADHLRRCIDRSPGAMEDLARGRAADLESRLLEDPVGGLHDALDLLRGENLDRRPRNLEPRQGRERGAARALGAPSITAAGWCRSFAHGSTPWDDGGLSHPCYTGAGVTPARGSRRSPGSRPGSQSDFRNSTIAC